MFEIGYFIHGGSAAQNCNEETQGRDMKVADTFLLEDRSIPVNNRTADPGQIPVIPGKTEDDAYGGVFLAELFIL